MDIREPEFIEVKALSLDNRLKDLPLLRLGTLLQMYHEAVVEYYDHVKEHGDCRRVNVFKDDGTGSDEQRALREHAPMQEALWMRLSIYNGEILRRVYHGKDTAIRLLDQFKQYVEDQVAGDASMPPSDARIEADIKDAESPPFSKG